MYDGILTVRIACLTDADLLFAWRNDPETRNQSHNTTVIDYDEHLAWFRAALLNPAREIRIVELDAVPVGTVRIDSFDGFAELSWTIAPAFRGRGVGKSMVKTIAEAIDGPVRAEVRTTNEASKKIAEYAGMKENRITDAIIYYEMP